MSESNIERDSGTIVGDCVVGGGHRGKRDDQDEAVMEFAERLDGMFPHDVTVRYNANRLGGGAWLVDGQRDAQVGLGAELKAPESHTEKFKAYLDGERDEKPKSIEHMDPERLRLRFSVHLVVPAIDESVEAVEEHGGFTDRPPRAHELFDEFDAAWTWFTDHVDHDGVNPPLTE